MPDISGVKMRAKDLHARINMNMVEEAKLRKISMSQLLEELDPTEEYGSGERLNALERQIELAGITTRTSYSDGFYADKFSAFGKDDTTRILGSEWLERQFQSVGKRILLSDLVNVTGPFSAAVAQITEEQLQPAVPVDSVVAGTSTIDGDSWRPMYVKGEGSDLVQKRVVEGDPLPEARLELGAAALTLSKYGRAIVASYELLRRMPIDMVALYIRMAARQTELDRVDRVRDIMVNGDGNPGTDATVHTLTSLDPATTAGNLTLKAWIAFKTRVLQPYAMNTVFVSQNTAIDLMFLKATDDAGTLLIQVPNNGLGGFQLINGGVSQDIQVAVLPGMDDNTIIGFDRNNAVQRVIEAGSNIAETMRWIRNQTQELTFSQNEGYAVMQPGAAKIMDLSS